MRAELAIADDDLRRIRQAAGMPVVESHRVTRGYTNNRRWRARLADGRMVFVKHADDEITADWLRREHHVYESLLDDLRPALLGWYDDGKLPVLILEDLSECFWPPPWTAERIDAVTRALRRLAAEPVIKGLPSASQSQFAELGWPAVAEDPEPFLALGVCSRDWLAHALPVLLEASALANLDGTSLVHLDIRSDNLCFRPDGSVAIIDWNLAAIGNPELDLAFWLPSLRLESGPEPWQVMQDTAPGVVARVAGFFASRAGLPLIPVAPLVREVQLRHLVVALPWATRILGLPAPDGHPRRVP